MKRAEEARITNVNNFMSHSIPPDLKMCLDCDTFFVGKYCPVCCNRFNHPVEEWLPPFCRFPTKSKRYAEQRREELKNAKRNLPIQEVREGSLHPTDNHIPCFDDNPEVAKEYHNGVSASQQTTTDYNNPKASSFTKTCEGNHTDGKFLGSKSNIKERGNRAHADTPGISKILHWCLQGGLVLSCKKYRDRVQNIGLLSKKLKNAQAGTK